MGLNLRRGIGRRAAALWLLGIVVAVLATSFAMRRQILGSAGRVLVADDPVGRADIIVVAIAADGAGVLEASDLFHAGVADRVAVFEDPPGSVDREFLRRGVPYEDEAARSTRQLHALGVSRVETIPAGFVAGTEAEGDTLPGWAETRGLRSLVVVTTSDHSRRLRRVLRRATALRGPQIAVRSARHSPFDPDSWWTDRGGIRIEIVELQKLLLDIVRHPVS